MSRVPTMCGMTAEEINEMRGWYDDLMPLLGTVQFRRLKLVAEQTRLLTEMEKMNARVTEIGYELRGSDVG